ncbi:uncharacterized [Lates japonicus]
MAVSTQADVPAIPGHLSNYLTGAKDLMNYTRAFLQTFKPQCQIKSQKGHHPISQRISPWPNTGNFRSLGCGEFCRGRDGVTC